MDAIRLLQDRGANIEAEDENGKTPWDLAREENEHEAAALLEKLQKVSARAQRWGGVILGQGSVQLPPLSLGSS